jgi:hypothetical protein
VATGKVEVLQRRGDGKPEWELAAQESRVSFQSDGRMKGSLLRVQGKIYDDDGLAATVTSEKGEADQSKKRLELSGRVIIKSKDGKTTLRAGNMRWLADLQLIEAWDGVEVITDDYIMGTFDKVWASADLTKVGTPDRFLQGAK